MDLKSLWEQLTDGRNEPAISYFTPAVEELSAKLPDYEHREYPKWVNGVLIQKVEDDPTQKAAEQKPEGDE
jgi:hypothetical protein